MIQKALLIISLFGIPMIFCFWRAYKIQSRQAVDGVVKGSLPYSTMSLWVIVGTAFLVFGLLAFNIAFNPGLFEIGKR
jgi:hypothetical protein